MDDPAYDPDDVATWKFLHMSPAAALASVALHVSTALALLPGRPPPREVHLSELAIAVTIELPVAASLMRAPAAAPADEVAAHRERPGWAGMDAVAPQRAEQLAVAVPLPAPSEPDPRQILPSREPPPLAGRAYGKAAPRSAGATLQPVMASLAPVAPLLTGREFGMSAPTATPEAPRAKLDNETPAPRHPVRQAQPRRAARQQAAAQAPTAAELAATHEAQDDYLRQIVRLLSRHRFQVGGRDTPPRGVVVASLTVARDGRLLEVSLERPSGFAGFDRSVVEAIHSASPFPPLPEAFMGERHSFAVPIAFQRER